MQLKKRDLWDPFRELEELNNRFGRLFGLVRPADNGEREALTATDWTPAVDISETEKEYRIRTELPDVKKDDVQVTLDSGVLTIQGNRHEEKEEKSEKFHRRELSYGHFLRRFNMPTDADEEKISATFKDGILNLAIAKTKSKAPKARHITVN